MTKCGRCDEAFDGEPDGCRDPHCPMIGAFRDQVEICLQKHHVAALEALPPDGLISCDLDPNITG